MLVLMSGCATDSSPVGRHMMDRDDRPRVSEVQPGQMMRAHRRALERSDLRAAPMLRRMWCLRDDRR